MLKFQKRLRLTTRMSVISQPGITSEPPPGTGGSCYGLLQIPSYSFSGRQVWVSGLSCSIALWLQDFYCHPELETAGLMKIYPFEASGPGQSRRLAESLAPLRQDCAAEWRARCATASCLTCLSRVSAPGAPGLWQKLA